MTDSATSGNDERLKRALTAIKSLRARVAELESEIHEPIAIIGAGCRLPGGVRNLDELWDLLAASRSGVVEFPPTRWLADEYYDPDPAAPGKMYTRWAGLLDDIAGFDAAFFGISPREAASMDPQHRIMLEVCWEALENAALPPKDLAGIRGAVIAGMTLNDYDELLRLEGPESIGPYNVSGNCLNFAPGRVAYTLGWHGPSMAVDSACSSSLLAVHLACRSLRQKEIDIALAGGVNILLSPDHTVMMCKNNMAAPDGRCKTFDASADGYVRGEGCAMVVLKRLSSALRDGDPIRAVIRGSAVNHDGPSSGLTVPNGLAQQSLMRAALEDANLDPGAVGYIEAHGTGTALGDPIEVAAINAVYGEHHDPQHPLALGSIKTNLGHLESAAGVTGLCKVIVSLEHAAIAPTLNLEQLNPKLLPDAAGMVFPTELTPWPAPDETRIGAVSSFGASGTNAHVLLEQAPAPASRPGTRETPSGQHLLCLSARSEAALMRQIERYTATLENCGDDASLGDVCYTAAAGRSHFAHRLAITGADATALLEHIAAARGGATSARIHRGEVAHAESTDVVFLFTGQGAQFPGMGQALFHTEPVFRETLEHCNEILSGHLPLRLLDVLFAAPDSAERDSVNETLYTQPALFALEYALAQLWRHRGVQPAVVAGHSIGEYTAACVAGVMSLDDALPLIAARGRLMQALPRGGAMAAVFAGSERVHEIIGAATPTLAIAAINSPGGTTISGSDSAVAAAVATLQDAGVRCKSLTVSHAFHSPLMEPMLAEFRAIAAAVTYAQPDIRLLSNVTGGAFDDSTVIDADYWCRHVREAVRFADNMAWLGERGYNWFIEIGPGSALLGLGQQCIADPRRHWIASMPGRDKETTDLSEAFAQLYVAGYPCNWNKYYADAAVRRTALPGYPFEHRTYWLHADGPEPVPWRRDRAPTAPGDERASIDAIRRELELSGGISDAEQALLPRLLDAITARQQTAALAHDASDWLLEPQWQSIRRASVPTDPASGGDWLIFGTAGPALTQLSDALTAARATVETVNLPSSDAIDAFDFSVVQQSGAGIIICGIDDLATAEAADATVFQHSHERLCRLVLALIRQLAQTPTASQRLRIVTRGAVTTSPEQQRSNPQQAILWGLAKVIPLEVPGILDAIIDLDPDADAIDGAAALAVLTDSADETEIALRGTAAYALRLRRKVTASAPEFKPAADASYLITGGLGGLGLELAQWLVRRGAKNVVLTSRSGAPDRAGSDAIERLRASGARIEIMPCDVADKAALATVVDTIDETIAPLRGIAHCAGVVANGMLLQQGWDAFAPVLAPKVAGAWNLHELSRARTLDWFVLYSTSTTLVGSDGQGNYAAANAFLDALAYYRRQLGLPGTVVNWGPWAEVGMATHEARAQELAAARGLNLMPPAAAMTMMDTILRPEIVQIGVLDAEWQQLCSRFSETTLPAALRDLVPRDTATGSAPAAAASRDIRAELAPLAPPQRHEFVVQLIQHEVAVILGFGNELPSPTLGLFDIGMDSLMAVELGVKLGGALACALPATMAFDHPTIAQIADYLLTDILSFDAAPATSTTPDEAADAASESLVDDIRKLSDDELESFVEAQLKGLDGA